ncbi:MAG: hypothetical protein Q4D38_04515 [Planctomycetia bacterium]|nr:hypothetical protein [Planctomycetia bacterium]
MSFVYHLLKRVSSGNCFGVFPLIFLFASLAPGGNSPFGTNFAAAEEARGADAPESGTQAAPEFQDRWFYASFGLRSDEEVEEMIQLLRDAESVGLNGMLWACGIERCGSWSDVTKERFSRIKTAADDAGVEIIPILWSVGYGTMLAKNANLVEALPIKNLQVVARNGGVEEISDSENVQIINGDFEDFRDGKFIGYGFHDKPGTISFRDTEVKHGGESSIRLENFGADKHGHGRVFQRLKVVPHRNYQIKLWYKTEGLAKRNVFRVQIYGKNGGLSSSFPAVPEDGTQDWKMTTLSFTTYEETEILFYVGIWDGTDGTLWLDDMTIEAKNMTAPVQRPGTPLVVKNAKTGEIYEQGNDFVPEVFRMRDFKNGVQKSPIRIPEGSRIEEGCALELSFYVPALTIKGQASTCMSEPELYEGFEESAAQIMALLAPKKWFLSMDEIRAANTCKACEDRNEPLGNILGECITRQYEIIQKVRPGAQVYIWSDMLDPNHNCHADYMRCRGDFSGVWDRIPKELIISCWYHKKREESMAFFSQHGFRTQAAAYYDVDTLETSREWLDVCRRTPNCTGIMYTTWRHRYELLKDFGRMLQEKR